MKERIKKLQTQHFQQMPDFCLKQEVLLCPALVTAILEASAFLLIVFSYILMYPTQ